jgi:hypothetical protein
MENYQAELEVRVQAHYDNSFNHTLHAHIDIAGDLVAGTLLSQILYWFAPDKEGKSKLRIIRDGHYWLVKERKDWTDEIRITVRQADRALKDLEKKNLIIKKIHKFGTGTAAYIRPNFDVLDAAISKWKSQEKIKIAEADAKNRKPKTASDMAITQNVIAELHKVSYQNYTKCKSGITQSVIPSIQRLHTETTTEITDKDYLKQQQPEKDVVVEKNNITSDNVVQIDKKKEAIQETEFNKKELIQICKEWASRPDCFGEPALKVSDRFWSAFIKEADKHNTDIIQAITDTYSAFRGKLDTIKSLQAVLTDGARRRWEQDVIIPAEEISRIKVDCLKGKEFTFYNWLSK